MVYSSERKKALSGWLQENNFQTYNNPFCLQKFLFFYEAFSKVSGDSYEFDGLKGYKRGPVFSAVWGDYSKDRYEFDAVSSFEFKNHPEHVNIDRARQTQFIVNVFSEDDLIDMTHTMKIWGAKKRRIEAGEQQVLLNESDFSEDDARLVSQLLIAFPPEMTEQYAVISEYEKRFVIAKNDLSELSESHFDTLRIAAKSDLLENPVYLSIENGVLLFD